MSLHSIYMITLQTVMFFLHEKTETKYSTSTTKSIERENGKEQSLQCSSKQVIDKSPWNEKLARSYFLFIVG